MSKENNGGPAFPFTPIEQPRNSDGTWIQEGGAGESGTTLRDYFAAKAMQSMLIANECGWNDCLIRDAYECADAMLKAREK